MFPPTWTASPADQLTQRLGETVCRRDSYEHRGISGQHAAGVYKASGLLACKLYIIDGVLDCLQDGI